MFRMMILNLAAGKSTTSPTSTARSRHPTQRPRQPPLLVTEEEGEEEEEEEEKEKGEEEEEEEE